MINENSSLESHLSNWNISCMAIKKPQKYMISKRILMPKIISDTVATANNIILTILQFGS